MHTFLRQRITASCNYWLIYLAIKLQSCLAHTPLKKIGHSDSESYPD